MTISLPTTAELMCDNCLESVDVDLTSYAGDPETVGFDSDDLPEGWTTEDDEHFCSMCSKKEN